MKLLILHMSDIHFSTIKYPDNPILSRGDGLLAAVRSLFIDPDHVGACLLLVAGDIAYAGLPTEYELATTFFHQIREGMKAILPNSIHYSVFIPGNHDCDFTKDGQARQKLIDAPDLESLDDGSVVDSATAIQSAFFRFCEQFNGTPIPGGLQRLYSRHELTVDEHVVEIRALNSAWMSRQHERRDIVLPLTYLSAQCHVSPQPATVITTLHHPYNWFDPTNAHSIRTLLEETSDLIITGHEHAGRTYYTIGTAGEHNEYIEGGVLQENGNSACSSFNVITIDIGQQSQSIYSFAWVSTRYECVNESLDQPFVRSKHRLKSEFRLSPDFARTLDDMDAHYSHPHKSPIRLSDVFLYPDFAEIDRQHAKPSNSVVHGAEALSHILQKKHIVITAPDKAGKTALSRALFNDLRRNAKIPLLLSGRTLKPMKEERIGKRLDTEFADQYSSDLTVAYWQLEKEQRAVIIDDYHLLPVAKEFRNTLIEQLLLRFDVIVIIAGKELSLQELMGHDRESRHLWSFAHCEQMAYGRRACADFIKQWYRIGREGVMEDAEMVQNTIAIEKTISQILGRDLLPPYPIYLLLLLQQVESAKPLDTSAATYGRLYGAVMTAHLSQSGVAGELETKLTYLAEFAHCLYARKSDHLTDEECCAWHATYCQAYLDNIEYTSYRDALVKSQVLLVRNQRISFRYKAGYYYFVALYLADNIATDSVRGEIEQLCGLLYKEEAANILLFLCHLSKDDLIVNSIVANATTLFAEFSEAEILADAGFLQKAIPALKPPVLDDADPEANRLRLLEEQDKRQVESGGGVSYAHEREESEGESQAPPAVLNVNAAFKTVQIAGQMLRNFGGKMRGPDRLRVAEACYALSLRVLKFAFRAIEDNEAVLIDAIKKTAMERDDELLEAKATEMAEGMVTVIMEFMLLGVVRNVATSVGLERLSPVFSAVLKSKPSIGRRIIDLAIRLEHFKEFPEDQVLGLYDDVRKAPIALDALQRLVYSRFYYFTSPADVKQRICDRVGIRIEARKKLLDYDKKKDVKRA